MRGRRGGCARGGRAMAGRRGARGWAPWGCGQRGTGAGVQAGSAGRSPRGPAGTAASGRPPVPRSAEPSGAGGGGPGRAGHEPGGRRRPGRRVRDELRELRQREAAPVAYRPDRQRQVPGARVGERGQERLPHPLEARGQAGLQPRGGRRALQGHARGRPGGGPLPSRVGAPRAPRPSAPRSLPSARRAPRLSPLAVSLSPALLSLSLGVAVQMLPRLRLRRLCARARCSGSGSFRLLRPRLGSASHVPPGSFPQVSSPPPASPPLPGFALFPCTPSPPSSGGSPLGLSLHLSRVPLCPCVSLSWPLSPAATYPVSCVCRPSPVGTAGRGDSLRGFAGSRPGSCDRSAAFCGQQPVPQLCPQFPSDPVQKPGGQAPVRGSCASPRLLQALRGCSGHLSSTQPGQKPRGHLPSEAPSTTFSGDT